MAVKRVDSKPSLNNKYICIYIKPGTTYERHVFFFANRRHPQARRLSTPLCACGFFLPYVLSLEPIEMIAPHATNTADCSIQNTKEYTRTVLTLVHPAEQSSPASLRGAPLPTRRRHPFPRTQTADVSKGAPEINRDLSAARAHPGEHIYIAMFRRIHHGVGRTVVGGL